MEQMSQFCVGSVFIFLCSGKLLYAVCKEHPGNQPDKGKESKCCF